MSEDNNKLNTIELNRKRHREDQGSSPELDIIRKSSKQSTRSPEGTNMGDISDIKNILKEIKDEMTECRKEMQKNNEEIRALREDMAKMKKEWESEKETLNNRLNLTENKLEKLEREKIRNNLVITGIKVDTEDKNVLKEAATTFIRQQLSVEANIIKAYKIGEQKCMLEMGSFENKLEILKNTPKLKGSKVYMDSALTYNERNIQRIIRSTAKSEKENGAKVKIGYQKIEIDGKILRWDNKQQKLLECPQNENSKN